MDKPGSYITAAQERRGAFVISKSTWLRLPKPDVCLQHCMRTHGSNVSQLLVSKLIPHSPLDSALRRDRRRWTIDIPQKKPPPPVTAARELKCHRRRLSSFFGQNKWWVSRTIIGEEGSDHRTHTHSIFGKLNSARPSSLGDAILSSGPIRSPCQSFSSFPKIIFLLAVEKPAVVPSDHLNNHTSPPTGTPHLPTH